MTDRSADQDSHAAGSSLAKDAADGPGPAVVSGAGAGTAVVTAHGEDEATLQVRLMVWLEENKRVLRTFARGLTLGAAGTIVYVLYRTVKTTPGIQQFQSAVRACLL